ncbi:hypothetical protein IP92_03506 [Pseudoduganella flava]|uniref:Type II toxin-antitoxin system VapB family antitoxin n=1 Tax=Pseudoduganella flava TaxID=871742 RepID=A0A562PP19_9BURK|nr:hypothetical protein [Pseudoduganella flava]QGZ40620.1 hypothetical protein GO485_17180 [Pseudoduganella flava]TWI46073.1 hypothetical protein IP92_03506 [Pseudoduganella flava]
MTMIEITLPRELAEEAAELGLLKSQVVAELLRDEIRRRTFSDLLAHGGLALDEPVEIPPRPRRRSS